MFMVAVKAVVGLVSFTSQIKSYLNRVKLLALNIKIVDILRFKKMSSNMIQSCVIC